MTAGGSPLTANTGVATFPHDADGREGLLAKAEEALCLARRSGGDRVAAPADD